MNKNIFTKVALLATFAAGMASLQACSDDREALSGEGTLRIAAIVNSDVKIASRADITEELKEKTILWISSPKGVVRKYNGFDNIPVGGIPLISDHYVAEVWTGDSLSASFDSKYYKGREEFDITAGNTTNVNIVCKVANSVVSVVYDNEVDDLIHDYTMAVGHKRGELRFEGRDDRKGYFMMPTYDKNLTWNLQGTLANGTQYTKSGTIESVKPATEYIIHVTYNGQEDSEEGGAYFTIVVEERAIEVNGEVEITLAPQFEGYNFDISEPLFGEVGKFARHSVLVQAVGSMNSIIVENASLNSLLGGADVDLLQIEDAVIQKLNDAGINWTYAYNSDKDVSIAKINFEDTFLNGLAEGEYTFNLSATDSYGKTGHGTLTVTASDAPVTVSEVSDAAVWAKSVTLQGRILKASATNPGVGYRKKGTQAFTFVAANVSGDNFTVAIDGLEPGTEYEYVAMADDYQSTSVLSFTTEAAPQLPNAGFENWTKNSEGAYLLTDSEDNLFWDSGNHGSITMSKNVTNPATDKVHSGTYSAKLESQFVGIGIIGKFAAGNFFAGKYLDTNGTNGVLGWGRTWTSRPKKLTGYYHYTPGTVEYASTDKVTKGQPDTGIIYIAIVDNSKLDNDGGKYDNWPQIVKTAGSGQFFDPNGSNVIAYGEMVFTGATEGDALVPFEITLNYLKKDVKACYLIITCSASRYGDYFSGGASTLYIDDLNLEY